MENLSPRLAESTLRLVSIPSVTGNERQIADYLETEVRSRAPGGSIHRIGESVVVVPPLRSDVPVVGLFGHSDTVKPAAEQPLGLREGRVFGCGATDMKGALAVMLELLSNLAHCHKAQPLFVFYDKEEGPMSENGLEPVLNAGVLPPMDLAIAMEPTDGTIQVGCVGSLHAEITYYGRRGHSARPWQGKNALYAAIPLLQYLAGRAPKEVRVGGFPFRDVLSVTQVQTSNSRNVVPDQVVFNLNYRFVPGVSEEEATLALRQELAPYLTGASVKVVDSAPSGQVCADHTLLRPWRDRLGLTFSPKQAWTDVARLSARGIPAVNFGPGETALAHQANESVRIQDLVACFDALMVLFSGRAAGELTS